ncbi:hypothetical protein HMPREF0216_00137 [Clostridium celatum DSM 1785]|uniref:Uncharacterized protein n=1 Tax=Clostridium celatum DSM 1785 TaxID=545697 RepID=L1QNH7_9CLOT|nr:hypothetical protein HMPREF0216_00137 [Clostridium celatum DSM 1785]
MPDFIEGLCIGLGLVLILVGMLYNTHNISQLKAFKKSLYNKILLK